MASPTPKKPAGFPALRFILWLLVLVGVGAGIRSASNRWNRESENRRVEVAVDFAELRSLSEVQSVPIAEVLKQFKAAGVTSVAVQEDTIGSLEDNKRIYAMLGGGTSGINLVPASTSNELVRIEATMEAKFPHRAKKLDDSSQPPLAISEPWSFVRGVGVGLDPAIVSEVRGAGLGVVGRISNWNGIHPQSLTWSLENLKKDGVSTILFSGDEVLGYKGYVAASKKEPGVATTDAELRRLDMYYGAIEFGKQKGDPQLAKAAPDRVVRVHTISGGEMLTETVPDAVQRFALAARERNIRLLFVRLFMEEPNALEFNTDYVAKIVKQLNKGKLQTGTAHGYAPLGVGTVPRLLIGLAIGAGFLLLVLSIFDGVGIISVLVALGLAGLAASPIGIGVKLAALAAALIFPSLGMIMRDRLNVPANKFALPIALSELLIMSAVTSLGIVCVIGLLADRSFLVKADAFVGIKATLAVPVLLVAIVYCLELRASSTRTFSKAWKDMTERMTRLSREPILIWQLVAAVVALGLVYVIISRSGNESGVGVSGLELKVRGLLDRFMYARPRFKDMFGHAAMVLALIVSMRTNRRDWALPLFIIGAFGQVSLLNTFCHLHTPIVASLWRALLGLAIGGALGVITYPILFVVVLRPLLKLKRI